MPEKNVTSFAGAAFRARIEKAIAAQQVPDAEFADIVYTALSAHGVPEARFREVFGVTKDAVMRWAQLRNLPQPSARPAVLRWIIENL